MTTDPTNTRWVARALCRSTAVDPAVFYPLHYVHERDDGSHTKCTDACTLCEAEMVCSLCEVATECLAFAMDVEPNAPSNRHGIWAGTTPSQRASAYRRQQRRAGVTA